MSPHGFSRAEKWLPTEKMRDSDVACSRRFLQRVDCLIFDRWGLRRDVYRPMSTPHPVVFALTLLVRHGRQWANPQQSTRRRLALPVLDYPINMVREPR